MERKLFVGDVVELKVFCLGNKSGTRGVVYEEYDIGAGPGAGIIFANGEYDGFSIDEQKVMIEKVGTCEAARDYQFDNVMRLSQDFSRGFFAPAFSPEDDIEQSRRDVG